MNGLYGNNIQSKVKRYYNWYGFWKGLFLVFRRTLTKLLKPLVDYHKMIVVRKNLYNKTKRVAPKISIKLDYLDTSNIQLFKDALKKYSWHRRINFIEPRIKDNEKCVLATYDGQICAFVWVAPGKRIVSYRSYNLPINDSQVFIRDALTIPAFRGKGIMAFMTSNVSEKMKEKGYKFTVGFVSSENHSSLKSLEKNNFEVYQIVRFINSPFLKKEIKFVRTYLHN